MGLAGELREVEDMPLSMARKGEQNTIKRVGGKEDDLAAEADVDTGVEPGLCHWRPCDRCFRNGRKPDRNYTGFAGCHWQGHGEQNYCLRRLQ